LGSCFVARVDDKCACGCAYRSVSVSCVSLRVVAPIVRGRCSVATRRRVRCHARLRCRARGTTSTRGSSPLTLRATADDADAHAVPSAQQQRQPHRQRLTPRPDPVGVRTLRNVAIGASWS
jgi:hypothetical protein